MVPRAAGALWFSMIGDVPTDARVPPGVRVPVAIPKHHSFHAKFATPDANVE